MTKRLIETLLTTIFWLKIFISPFAIGSIAGGVVFLAMGRSSWGMAAWIIFGLIGSVIGALWAEHIRKTEGLLAFNSRLGSSPDLDGKRSYKTIGS